ncbi:hypothetical protein PR048_017544 [Dryococelus australis]|uniref:Uncharacterized protein n=1 Tax=Dryococelus australis TaxID=614101 RepID=A0ABQ9H9T4_9NEOP|nr:hypothetical protein PR048_017544 [Dryococelus australis]
MAESARPSSVNHDRPITKLSAISISPTGVADPYSQRQSIDIVGTMANGDVRMRQPRNVPVNNGPARAKRDLRARTPPPSPDEDDSCRPAGNASLATRCSSEEDFGSALPSTRKVVKTYFVDRKFPPPKAVIVYCFTYSRATLNVRHVSPTVTDLIRTGKDDDGMTARLARMSDGALGSRVIRKAHSTTLPLLLRHKTKGVIIESRTEASRRSEKECANAGIQGRGKWETSEKTRIPEASSSTIPTGENPGATPPGIEPGSPPWEASSLTTTPPKSGCWIYDNPTVRQNSPDTDENFSSANQEQGRPGKRSPDKNVNGAATEYKNEKNDSNPTAASGNIHHFSHTKMKREPAAKCTLIAWRGADAPTIVKPEHRGLRQSRATRASRERGQLCQNAKQRTDIGRREARQRTSPRPARVQGRSQPCVCPSDVIRTTRNSLRHHVSAGDLPQENRPADGNVRDVSYMPKSMFGIAGNRTRSRVISPHTSLFCIAETRSRDTVVRHCSKQSIGAKSRDSAVWVSRDYVFHQLPVSIKGKSADLVVRHVQIMTWSCDTCRYDLGFLDQRAQEIIRVYTLCDENTARQLRALRLEAMTRLMHVAVSFL